MTSVPTLTTERLGLRGWRPDDLDAYAAMLADLEVRRYLGNGQPLSRDEAQQTIEAYVQQWPRLGHGRWAVEERASGALIGMCGLLLWREGTPEETGELGYHYARSHWGLGFATEAARAALEWAFATIEFPRVVGLTHPENVASQRVLSKLGMRYVEDVDGPFHRMRLHAVDRAGFAALEAGR